MNVASQIEMGRLRRPDRAALYFEGCAYSYREVDQRASGAARELDAMGVTRGDRVALCLPNTPEFVFWYLGILKLGAIAVCINPGLTEDEIRYMLDDSGASVVLRQPKMPEPAEFATGDLPDDTPAVIVYTSGTTGFPKGAVLSHGNVLFVAEAKRRYLGITEDDRLLLFLPLFHCFGQNAILNAAFAGGAAVELQRGFDVERVLEAIERGRVTMLCGVPTNFIVLCDRATPDQMRRVRYCMSAAAPLPVQIERRWRERFGKTLHQGYGLTESSPFASYNHHEEYREGAVGTPIEGVEMRIVDVDTGRPLPPGEKGEIVVRGPNVMLGYWRKPEETRQVIQDGWLHTGDIGCVDDDGYFRVEDRLKDMVIVGGFNVYPVEVENALFRHPAVAEAAVYGVPDPILGERLRAAVVMRSGATASAEDLLAFCRPCLAEYKLPVEFEFVGELPKGRTGKVLKRVLRERFRANGNGHRSEILSNAAELENRIVNWLAERLPPGIRPDPEKTLADSGFTSLLALELAERMSHWVGREVRPTVTWSYPTPALLARHLMGEEKAGRTAEGGIAAEIAGLSDADVESSLAAELHKLARAQTAGEA